jgi:aspartate/methionine/tyrosine aminotransferase
MENLTQWLAGERDEILTRRSAIEAGAPALAERGWRLLGSGAYFAYMEHPFDISAADLAPHMVRDCGVLCLPGTMFVPEGDTSGARQLRIAFANLDTAGIGVLFERLADLKV